ncbi:MAG: membrane protein insertion efficiency factor YidD [Candidatus Dormibacteraeota bacterium]|nr:membrane protein insertion efficiency factor YidD [Candidatus Dormibacteraeota bacterium]
MSARQPSAASRFALRFIATYRLEVSGRRGHICGSSPSCSEYGELAYRNYGFFTATALTLRHLVACGPPARDTAQSAGEVTDTPAEG